MPSRVSSEWPRWLLPLFFAAHVVVTAALIPLLRVADPIYHAIPLVFGAAFGLSLVPQVGRRLVSGGPILRIAPVILYAAVVTLASSVNPRPAIVFSTGWFHSVEFAGLTLLAQLVAHPGAAAPLRPGRVVIVLLACVAFGALDELHQIAVPGRVASAADLGRDALGAIGGTILFATGRFLLARRGERDGQL